MTLRLTLSALALAAVVAAPAVAEFDATHGVEVDKAAEHKANFDANKAEVDFRQIAVIEGYDETAPLPSNKEAIEKHY